MSAMHHIEVEGKPFSGGFCLVALPMAIVRTLWYMWRHR